MKQTRSCIICKKKQEKKELIRIVSGLDKVAFYDKKQKENKRGIYFCKDKKCLGFAIKNIDKGKLNNVKIDLDKKSLKTVLEDILLELGE